VFDLGADVPIVVVWLVFGAIYFTLKMKFINFRGFKHAIELVKGDYDDPNDKGEVSHFQALTTALSATVGLGNIAGVAIAIPIGGPGATFWRIVAGLLGMSAKFVECTLGVKYRKLDENGEVSGGPMYYLRDGLAKYKMAGFGKVLAVLFAILCIGGSFGGGNMFQANQAYAQVAGQFPALAGNGPMFGLILAILVGTVIIGGIKSIANVTEKIVPFMAAIYVLACLFIILSNFSYIDDAFGLIFSNAFSMQAGFGGLIGVLIVGFQRAAFSNEAGAGSASIAHSAVKTKYAASEGIVALLEPFIDTVVICTMTALVIIMYNSGGIFEYGSDVVINGEKVEGAVLITTSDSNTKLPKLLYIIITSAVIVQITTVSINGSNKDTIPSETGSLVLAAECAIEADPTPASFEKAAL
jgi:AGCS family alanine or glycine:cation symporter